MTRRERWNGFCPAGKHGLDYAGQPCDLCPAVSAETKWTAGPWKIQRRPESVTVEIVAQDDDVTVVAEYVAPEDAPLLVAARDLYAALAGVLPLVSDSGASGLSIGEIASRVRAAHRALAAARGEQERSERP